MDCACPCARCKYGAVVKAKVIVMPKAAVLDPQGNAVRDAMRHLGMPEVRSVRIGKYLEIDLDGKDGDLEKRLHTRAQDSDEVIRGRMSRATHELSHWAEYDYIVINHDIDEAFAEVQSILKAERLKRERRTGLTTFVRGLQRQLEK